MGVAEALEGVLAAEAGRKEAEVRALRDPEWLEGKCGVCPFRFLCGGSRARAWAATGNPFAEDPACAYQPEARAEAGD